VDDVREDEEDQDEDKEDDGLEQQQLEAEHMLLVSKFHKWRSHDAARTLELSAQMVGVSITSLSRWQRYDPKASSNLIQKINDCVRKVSLDGHRAFFFAPQPKSLCRCLIKSGN
jgi:hypothetical protein